MPAIERNIHLNVPVEMALEYLSEPVHLLEFCPSVIEVGDVHRRQPGGTEFSWVFKMIGVRFTGEAEIKETQHHQVLEMHFWGGIKGSIAWHMQPVHDGVLLTVTIDYALPAPLLKKHSEEMIIQNNEQATECMLKSVKTLLGEQVAAPSAG